MCRKKYFMSCRNLMMQYTVHFATRKTSDEIPFNFELRLSIHAKFIALTFILFWLYVVIIHFYYGHDLIIFTHL